MSTEQIAEKQSAEKQECKVLRSELKPTEEGVRLINEFAERERKLNNPDLIVHRLFALWVDHPELKKMLKNKLKSVQFENMVGILNFYFTYMSTHKDVLEKVELEFEKYMQGGYAQYDYVHTISTYFPPIITSMMNMTGTRSTLRGNVLGKISLVNGYKHLPSIRKFNKDLKMVGGSFGNEYSKFYEMYFGNSANVEVDTSLKSDNPDEVVQSVEQVALVNKGVSVKDLGSTEGLSVKDLGSTEGLSVKDLGSTEGLSVKNLGGAEGLSVKDSGKAEEEGGEEMGKEQLKEKPSRTPKRQKTKSTNVRKKATHNKVSAKKQNKPKVETTVEEVTPVESSQEVDIETPSKPNDMILNSLIDDQDGMVDSEDLGEYSSFYSEKTENAKPEEAHSEEAQEVKKETASEEAKPAKKLFSTTNLLIAAGIAVAGIVVLYFLKSKKPSAPQQVNAYSQPARQTAQQTAQQPVQQVAQQPTQQVAQPRPQVNPQEVRGSTEKYTDYLTGGMSGMNLPPTIQSQRARE